MDAPPVARVLRSVIAGRRMRRRDGCPLLQLRKVGGIEDRLQARMHATQLVDNFLGRQAEGVDAPRHDAARDHGAQPL